MQQQHNTIPATPLPLTRNELEWQQQRNEGIGSSDASIIFGLSTYESPYSLWLQKTGQTPLDVPVDDRTQELRRFGHIMEPIILAETNTQLGTNIIKPDRAYRHPEIPWLRCNLDGWEPTRRAVGEFKNVQQFQAHQWDGQVADHAEIQVHHAAAVLSHDKPITNAIVSALIGGNQLRINEIEINPNIVEIIIEQETKFWKCVETRTPPDVDGHERTLQALTKEWAHRPKPQEVSREQVEPIWEDFHRAKQAEAEAKELKRLAQAKLAQLMDGHDALTTGDKYWAKTTGGRLDVNRLAADEPELVAKYVEPQPTFNTEKFKQDHAETYRKYQFTSITPTKKKD